MTVIDLFSGAGGFHIGFERAGYNVALCIDNNAQVEKTHKSNYDNIPFFNGDMRQLSGAQVLNMAHLNDVDVLIGGPPCQGFSTIGKRISSDPNKRYSKDDRNDLVFEYIRLLKEIRPKFFVMENVKGLTSINKGLFFEAVIQEYKKLSEYQFDYTIINVADYGVPQIRKRTLIIGNRLGIHPDFPLPTHSENGENGLEKWNNCWNSILDLVDIKEDRALNHVPLRHTEKIIERYKYIPEGGRLPEDKLPANLYRKNFGNTYKRLDRSRPALTMVPGNDAFPIHPVLNRSLTVREAARIQTFPDTIIFEGNRRQQGYQVGNAVPPQFSEILALHIKKELDDFYNRGA